MNSTVRGVSTLRWGTVFILLAAACGGGSSSGDWYYHWNCNGDSQCLATNPTGQASGTLDEGPVKVNCTQLMQFAARFWGSAATNSCDQIPGGGVGGGGGGGPAGPPTISNVTPSGAPNTTIVVSGTNFPSSSASFVGVQIGGLVAGIISKTPTSLNVAVPNLNAGSYPLTVTTALGTATWGSLFQVTNYHQPFALVVDASSVYWTERDYVKKVSTSGGAVTTLASGASPQYIAQDSANVYWTEYYGGVVRSVPKSGGSTTTLASGLRFPWGIAVDGNFVYWTADGSSSLLRAPKGGGAATTLVNDVAAGPSPVAVDATSLYYVGPGNLVSKAPLAGGSATALATFGDPGSVFALDSSQIYWGYSALHRTPLAGGSTGIYGASVFEVQALAVDASNLYFVSGGSISALLLSNSSVNSLVPMAGAQRGLATDANNVYWTSPVDASVRKIPKAGGAVVTLASSPNVP